MMAVRKYLWLAVLILLVVVSCKEEETTDGGASGVLFCLWDDPEVFYSEGGERQLAFTAAAAWTARSSDASWCVVTSESGVAGKRNVRLRIAPNSTGEMREAVVTVLVEGYAPVAFRVRQFPDWEYAEINWWVEAYMRDMYLWNEALEDMTCDYGAGYEGFLSSMLEHAAARDNVNRDDGHWKEGVRQYFYSNVRRYPASTRGTRTELTGTGIERVMWWDAKPGYFIIASAAPGSPASRAGLRRGMCITAIDGRPVRADDPAALFGTPEKTVSLTVASLEGRVPVDEKTVSLSPATYDAHSVWLSEVMTVRNNRKAGYLCCMSFNTYFDGELLSAFADFKSQQVTDLIVDLRYNGGGYVVSSVLLGTLVTGEAKKDQTYCKLSYNARRTAAGQTDSRYLIGNPGTYSLLKPALDDALALNRIYVLCSESTASASEMVINGLRGLDVEVRLIGTATNGKNVGMEGQTMVKDGYEYVFSPITFYAENAKGFRDFSNGFVPDLIVDETDYPVYDWGSADDLLLGAALAWIGTGVKPELSRTRGGGKLRSLPPVPKRLEGALVLPGEQK